MEKTGDEGKGARRGEEEELRIIPSSIKVDHRWFIFTID